MPRPKQRGETGRPPGPKLTRLLIATYAGSQEQFDNFKKLARRRDISASRLLREIIDRELREAGLGPETGGAA